MIQTIAALIALCGWLIMLTEQPHEWAGLSIFLTGAAMLLGTFIERRPS